jgi:hypothetical protein
MALPLLIALLFLGVYWSWTHYCQSRRQLQVVQVETVTCRRLAASIALLRQKADPAAVLEMPEDQLYHRLHEAAQAAGLQDDRVIRSIRPQPPRAVRGTSLEQKTVELSLEGLTLEQFVRFLYRLHAANPQLQITALTLHEPKGWGTAALWDVEPLVLNYQVRAPRDPMPRNPAGP